LALNSARNIFACARCDWTPGSGKPRRLEPRRCADAADPWAELLAVPEILAAAQAAEASNAPFTPGEQAEISRRLDEIKTLVRQQFELTEEQFAAMDYKLDEVKEAAKIDLTTTDATSIIAPTMKPPAPMPCQIT
jgi:hypothetical protein